MANFKSYKDALQLNIPRNFGPDEDYYDEFNKPLNEVFDQLDSSCITKWGISQFVILHNDWDVVIKIPFCGWQVYNEDKDTYTFEKYNTNYCDLSYSIYCKAEDANLEDFFAKTEFLGTTADGTPIYTQEAIKETMDDYLCDKRDGEHRGSKDSLELVRNSRISSTQSNWHMFYEDWLAAAIDEYGYDKVSALLAFLAENNLTDFHDGNYGYRTDGTPVLIDWAGFDEG